MAKVLMEISMSLDGYTSGPEVSADKPRFLGLAARPRPCMVTGPSMTARPENGSDTAAAVKGSRAMHRRAFIRHFAEMVVAMLVGMGVLGGLAMLAFAAAGSGTSDQPGALRVTLMGVYMTVPMVLWMRFRGHAAGRCIEMAGSMIVPTLGVAALAAVGALGAGAALEVQHAVMVPAMLGVMLWRYGEYASTHPPSPTLRGARRRGGVRSARRRAVRRARRGSPRRSSRRST